MNRLVLLAVALVVGSAFVVPLAEALEPVLAAFAVVLLALFGLAMLLRAPF
jgi:hypothetical protein